jgi:Zn-dependent protease
MQDFLLNLIFIVPSVLIGVSVHESSHALAAYWLGDDTAKREGRITLNPVKHITWITVVFALIAALPGMSMFIPFKPVPIDHSRLKDRRWGPGLTAIAGPLSNLLLGLVSVLLGRIILFFPLPETVINPVILFIQYFSYIQLMLFLFNILPIPPLDGHWVLGSLFPVIDRFFQPFRYNFAGFFILLLLLQIPVIRELLYKFSNSAVLFIETILPPGA